MSERLWAQLSTLLAWGLGILFIYAGVEKIIDPKQFAQSIKYFQILPLWLINGVALVLPWWEVAAGIAILTRSWRRVGGWLILLMLLVFTIAIVSAVSHGLDISCGCFGQKSSKAGLPKIAENVGMLAASAMVLWYRSSGRTPDVMPIEAAQPAT